MAAASSSQHNCACTVPTGSHAQCTWVPPKFLEVSRRSKSKIPDQCIPCMQKLWVTRSWGTWVCLCASQKGKGSYDSKLERGPASKKEIPSSAPGPDQVRPQPSCNALNSPLGFKIYLQVTQMEYGCRVAKQHGHQAGLNSLSALIKTVPCQITS